MIRRDIKSRAVRFLSGQRKKGTLLGAFALAERVRFRTRLARKDKCLLQISRRKLNKLPSAIYGVLNRKVFRDKNKEQPYWAAPCFYGGESEIRTHGTVLAFTRFPVVRLRPAQPSLQATMILYHKDFEKSIEF